MGSGQQPGTTVTCAFTVSNATGIPPGLYTFNIQVFDNSTYKQQSRSPSALVDVGPVLLAQASPSIATGQTEVYTVYMASGIAPFNTSTGPYTATLYLQNTETQVGTPAR